MKGRSGYAGPWRSVVFTDLDNTLLEGPFQTTVFPTISSELAGKAGLKQEEVRYLLVKENLDRQRNPNIPATLAMDWDDIVNAVAEGLGVSPELKVVDLVRSHASPPYTNVLETANEVLQQLTKPYRAIVAATKGLKKYQIPVLDALGLTPLFDDILTPDTHHILKQDLAFYGSWPTITRLQVSVGDHYQDDVVAPNRFGFRTVWKLHSQNHELTSPSPLTRPKQFNYARDQAIKPDAIILQLQELPAVVSYFEESQGVCSQL
jgi:FMN phosphatase YigB (HAD superfamily)